MYHCMKTDNLIIDSELLKRTDLSATEKLVISYVKVNPEPRMVEVALAVGISFNQMRRVFTKLKLKTRE